LDRTRVNTIKN